ncbi:Crp/Fnr family transcriptional regulator [Geobacillus stearothermophilus]|uniref:Crp/Fnr family transcriptional regulator n=1 Tax=Geobacillus TaxID=129337 RepID=UPI000500836B|nr:MULTISPECIES: Crp/Fnr family transcriptional regulator [unclassified Geobacillus]KFX32264.1 Crp/Fnr family transcriptional regulator [Geobacillus stearothermophilus]PJW16621.1 Crp/Fnr family transcriptional regulator [Geobacillus sp. WSUCF-018B]
MERQSQPVEKRDFSLLRSWLQSSKKVIPLRKHSFLFQEGMPANELYLILSGKVQVSKIGPDGKEMCFRICGSGEIVGELTLFTNDPRYLLTAKVIEPGEAAVMNKNELEEQLLINPTLTLEYMRWMSKHARRTQTKFRDLMMNGKKGALYSTLIRLCNSYGVPLEDGSIFIDVTLKNQDLANFCGTTRESVNRMLNALKQDGIISMKRGRITVHDLNYLKTEIQCEDCPPDICCIE